MNNIQMTTPKRFLKALANQIDHFYLVGGTALSLIYYQHRESYDLDFFTQDFNKENILRIMDHLQASMKCQIKLRGENLKEGHLKIVVYIVTLDDGSICKIDFVEDQGKLLNPLRSVDGIDVISLEDIYIRKIFAIAGHIESQDEIGRGITIGGRQEAKDFYDLYCLSNTTNPLSEFVLQFDKPVLNEGLIRWFNTYDRMTIRTGLLDLVTAEKFDYRVIEEHFKGEINKILSELI